MANVNIDDLESIIKETTWCNEEAIRLFHHELRCSPLMEETTTNLDATSTKSNLLCVDTHLLRVSHKLDKIDVEILKWKQMKEKLKTITEENEDINQLYMDQKKRTKDLYQSLNTVMGTQQTQESQIHDLKLKCRMLLRDNKKALNYSTEISCDLRRLEDKCRNLIKVRDRRVKDCALLESTIMSKKAKMITTSISSSSSSGGSSSSSSSYSSSSSSSNHITNSSSSSSSSSESTKVYDKNSNSSLPNPPNPRKRVITSCNDIPQHDLITAPNGNGSASISNMCVSTATLDTVVFIPWSNTNDNEESNIVAESIQQASHRKVPNQSKVSSITHVPISKHPVQRKEASEFTLKKLSPECRIESYIGGEIKKPFRGYSGIFTGIVKSYRQPYFTICYEDGDKEEMTETELLRWLVILKNK